MGEPRRHRRPKGREAGTGKGPPITYHGRTSGGTDGPSGGGCYCSSGGVGNIEALLSQLLPTAPVPPPRSIPTDMELLLQCLLSGVPTPMPTPSHQTGMTGMETLLQRLQPGASVLAAQSQPTPAHRDWSTMVCFSCGKSCHVGVGNWMRPSRTCFRGGRWKRWAPITW